MKTIMKSALIGVAVVIAGIYFSELFSVIFNGLDRDTGRLFGLGIWLCFVISVSTGIIISQINKHNK